MFRRLYLGLCGSVFLLALLMLASTPWLSYTINLTHSLPGHVFVVSKNASFSRGDLVAFRWHGGFGYPMNAIFIKKVAGLPGDQIKVVRNTVWVAGQQIGVARVTNSRGLKLHPIASGTLANQRYFVMAPHPDSLDSRYAEVGTVHQSAILGRAYALF